MSNIFFGTARSGIHAFLAIVTVSGASMALFYSPFIDHQFNADAFYLINLVYDIVFDGGNIRDWYRAPHYLVFPDMPIAAIGILLSKLGLNIYMSFLLIYLMLASLIAGACWQRIVHDTFWESLLSGATIVCGAYLLMRYSYHGLLQYSYAAEPRFPIALGVVVATGHTLAPLHGGALMMAFCLFLVAAKPQSSAGAKHYRRRESFQLVLVGVLSALTTFSDTLFILWGLSPLSVMLVTQIRTTGVRHIMQILLACWFSAGAGFIASSVKNPTRFDYFQSVHTGLANSVQNLGGLLSEALAPQNEIVLAIIGINVILWVAAAYHALRALRGNSTASGSLIIFCGSLSFLSVLGPVITGMLQAGIVRLFMPFILLGPISFVFSALLLARHLKPRYILTGILVAVDTVIVACGINALVTNDGPTANSVAACLRENNQTEGFADFWDAGPIRSASGWAIAVTPLIPETSINFSWLANKAWVKDHPRPHFAIATLENSGKLTERFGEPSQIIQCKGRSIWLYE